MQLAVVSANGKPIVSSLSDSDPKVPHSTRHAATGQLIVSCHPAMFALMLGAVAGCSRQSPVGPQLSQ